MKESEKFVHRFPVVSENPPKRYPFYVFPIERSKPEPDTESDAAIHEDSEILVLDPDTKSTGSIILKADIQILNPETIKRIIQFDFVESKSSFYKKASSKK